MLGHPEPDCYAPLTRLLNVILSGAAGGAKRVLLCSRRIPTRSTGPVSVEEFSRDS